MINLPPYFSSSPWVPNYNDSFSILIATILLCSKTKLVPISKMEAGSSVFGLEIVLIVPFRIFRAIIFPIATTVTVGHFFDNESDDLQGTIVALPLVLLPYSMVCTC